MAGVSGRHCLQPSWDPGQTIAQLSLSDLLSHGIRAAVIDVDRTLLPGRDVQLSGPVKAWLVDARQSLHLHLFSNNPSQRRISAVADQLEVGFTFGARKPHRAALRRVVADLNLPPECIAMVGDRLLTDVLGGNRLGLFTILVRPIASDGGPCTRDGIQRLERTLARWLGAPAA